MGTQSVSEATLMETSRTFWHFRSEDLARIALLAPGTAPMTYGELDDLATGWMGRLREIAGEATPILGIELIPHPSAIAAYIAGLRLGMPILVAGPGQLAVGQALYDQWQPELRLIAKDDGVVLQVDDHAMVSPKYPPSSHPDLRLLLSTSGSTGDPKLVRLSGGAIASNAAAIAEYLSLTAQDRAPTTLPLYYSYGLSVLNSHLAAGASVMLTEASVMEPEFWTSFQANDCTSVALVPHQCELIHRAQFRGLDAPSLRYATQAGGRLAPDLVREFQRYGAKHDWQFFVMYGQTEAAPRMSYLPPEDIAIAADTIGRAIPGGQLWLVDEYGQKLLEPGAQGELVYAGPNVMMGYASARADLARGAEIDVLHTGDLAERTEHGCFRLLGRLKRFVKLYGLRLSLDQIEHRLSEAGLTADAVEVDDHLVILHRDGNDAARVVEVLSAAFSLPTDAILTQALPEVPRLPSGKRDHVALREIARTALDAARTQFAPEDRSLADVLSSATRQPTVLGSDSFASLGGDSLSHLSVEMYLEVHLGHVPDGWQSMTLAELDQRIASKRQNTSDTASDPSRLTIDIPLRIAAIALVVMQHASDYPLNGGTWLLVLLSGYTMASRWAQDSGPGRPSAMAFNLLYPILPLYFLILLAYALLRPGEVPGEYAFLVGNYYTWERGSVLEVYWYVSLYAQLVLIAVIVAAIPWLRKVIERHPWPSGVFAAAVLTAILAVLSMRWGPAAPSDAPYIPQRGLVENLALFLIGWILHGSKKDWQVAVTLGLGLAVLLALSQLGMTPTMLTIIAVGILLLAVLPELRVPPRLSNNLKGLAALTMFVYLTHVVLAYVVLRIGLPDPAAIILTLLGAFPLAYGIKRAYELIDRQFWSRGILVVTPHRDGSASGRSGPGQRQ